MEEQISGNFKPFGFYSPGRDNKLRNRVYLSFGVPDVLDPCPGE